MFKKVLIVSAIVFTTPALAQQIDSAFLQRALGVLQTQRNNALDAQASAEARAAGLVEELAKANAKIKELTEQTKPVETPPVKK